MFRLVSELPVLMGSAFLSQELQPSREMAVTTAFNQEHNNGILRDALNLQCLLHRSRPSGLGNVFVFVYGHSSLVE